MKRGQLIKYSGEILFFKNYAKNEAWRLVPDLFLLFKKALYNIKASGPHFSFHIFWWVSTWAWNKNKFITFQTVNSEVLQKGQNLQNLWKDLGLDLPHLVYDFSRKMFLMLYSINWLNFCVWLTLILEMLGDRYMEIIFLSMLWRHKFWN